MSDEELTRPLYQINWWYCQDAPGGASGNGTVFSISFPQRLMIVPDSSSGFFIGAQGQPNFTCQLQRAPTLTGPWSTIASQTADTNGLILFHELSPQQARFFYRTVQQ